MVLEFQNTKQNFDYLLLDYTGTLSEHGKLVECVKDKLVKLSNSFKSIYVLTADTFGTAREQLKGLPVNTVVFDKQTKIEKRKFVKKLDAKKCIAIGNGNNDIEMLRKCALSIAVINKDGCNAKLLAVADLVFNSICDALDALLEPKIIISLMRD